MTRSKTAESVHTAGQRCASATIRLEQRDDGGWLATRSGVSVEGYGQSAGDAAAEYCRKVGSTDE